MNKNRLSKIWNHWRYYGLDQDEYNKCMDLVFPDNLSRLVWANMVFAILTALFAIFPIITEHDFFKSEIYLVSTVLAIILCIFSKYKNYSFKQKNRISKNLIYTLIFLYFVNVIFFGLYLAVWANPGKIAGSFIGIFICVLFLINISPLLYLGLTVFTAILYIICVIRFKIPSVWNYDIQNAIFAGAVALIFGWQIIMNRLTNTSSKNKLEKMKDELLIFNGNLQNMVREKVQNIVELQEALLKTIAELVDCRDDITGGHIERTQRGIKILIDELSKRALYNDEINNLDVKLLLQSCQLHDVGKISIADSILKKPGKLDNEEFLEMKKHTIFGGQIIERIESLTKESEFLKYAKIFAVSHHENWDGTGYPKGLKGTDIPLLGRIMAIADVYDALISERPYKKAYTHEEATRIIVAGNGIQFDPALVEVFLQTADQFKG